MNFYKEWLLPLEGVVRNVSSIAPDTEDEFLALGAKLQEYVGQADEMTGLAASIVEHTGGGASSTIDQAESVFQNTFQGIEDCCNEFNSGLSMIDNVALKLDSLFGFQGTLEGIAKYTRIMGVSIKIESARVGQEGKGFWDLAQEVTDLAVRIHENVMSFKESLNASKSLVQSCIAEMGQKTAMYRSEISSVWNRINSLLENLVDSFEESASVAKRISLRSKEIHRHIGEIVVAMQFHDITRQQLEHVVEAINEVCSHLEESSDGHDERENNDEKNWIGHAISIQTSHLREISKEVKNAGASVIDGLRDVARLSGEQVKDALILASGGGIGSGETIFDRLEKELDSVASILAESTHFISDMVESLEAVSGSIEEMGKNVNEIKEVGARIKLSALNALAEATRTGDKGRALRVLAKELHLFSEGTSVTTGDVTEALNEVSTATRAQEEFIQRMEEKQEDVKQMMQETMSFSKTLGDEAITVKNAAKTLDESCDALLSSIEEVIRSITFPHRMSENIDACATILSDLLEKGDFNEDTTLLSSYGNEMLRKFASRYSMEREREIHRQASMEAGTDSSLDTSHTGGGTSDEDAIDFFRDDNIVLFDNEIDGQNGAERQEDGDMPRLEKASSAQGSGDDELGDNIELF